MLWQIVFTVLGIAIVCASVAYRARKPKVDLLPALPAEPKHEHPDLMAHCSDEANIPVMEQVQANLGELYNDVNVDYGTITAKDLDKEQQEIFRLFDWSKTVKDDEIKSCYEAWLGYYDYQLEGAYKELPKVKQRRAWERTHTLPKMPEGKP